MPRSVDVVVVGGGIFGCAVAWNLARRGAGSVLLLERGGIAQQTTSRADLYAKRERAIDLFRGSLRQHLGPLAKTAGHVKDAEPVKLESRSHFFGPAPKAGSEPYDVSKAAVNHLRQ